MVWAHRAQDGVGRGGEKRLGSEDALRADVEDTLLACVTGWILVTFTDLRKPS